MEKILSKEALLAAYNACKARLVLRCVNEHDINSAKKELLCCGGTGCHASNSQDLMQNLRDAIKEAGLENDVSRPAASVSAHRVRLSKSCRTTSSMSK